LFESHERIITEFAGICKYFWGFGDTLWTGTHRLDKRCRAG